MPFSKISQLFSDNLNNLYLTRALLTQNLNGIFRDPLSYIGWSWSWWMPVPVIMFNDISFYPQFIFSFTTNIRSYFIQHSANPNSCLGNCSLLPEWDNYTWRRHLDWIVLKERLMRANYQSFRYISAKEWHLSCSLTLNSSSSNYFFSSFSWSLPEG